MDADTMETRVSLIEVRAWALASKALAEREGFPRTAAAIGERIEELEAMRDAGFHSVKLVPIKD